MVSGHHPNQAIAVVMMRQVVEGLALLPMSGPLCKWFV